MSIEIVPLDCGRLSEVQRAAHQYMTGFGETTYAHIVVWLIRTPNHNIALDIGCASPKLVKERYGRVLEQSESQTPRAAASAAGVDPDDVDIVIQTHMHWDHTLGFEDNPFPNATVYVQRSEIAYAGAPYPCHRGLYDASTCAALTPGNERTLTNLKVIDGDFHLDDGVEILHMPGHTPGLQGALVTTGGTRYAIASDNVPWQTSWNGRTPEDWIPTGIHVSLTDCYDSMARLARVADVVFPSHDACVFDAAPYQGERS